MSYLRRSNISNSNYSPQKGVSSPLKYNGINVQNTTSPYKQYSSPTKDASDRDQDHSYFNNNNNQEAELWKSRCQNLETSLYQTNNDLLNANTKLKQSQVLEGQIEQMRRNQNSLVGNNDSISKQLTQKQAECDIWKQKYEKEVNDKILLKSSNDLTIRKLQDQLTNIKQDYDALQVNGYREQEDLKANVTIDSHSKINKLKSDHCEDITLYEEQSRKLREILEEREREISVLNQKLTAQKSESELERTRLLEEKQKVQAQLSQIEVENQRSKSMNQQRADLQQANNIENLKLHYQNEIDILTRETQKLKELLELKQGEIQALINQNKDQKINNEEEQNGLRDEIEELKQKILDNNEQKLREIEDITNSLEQAHATDLQGLRFHQENQVEALEKEIEKLHEMIENKTQQIDVQIREKLEQRQNYNSEIERQNEVIQDLKNQQIQLQGDLNEIRKQKEEEVQFLTNKYEAELLEQKQHNEELRKEIQELQSLLEARDNDIQNTRQQHQQIEASLEKQLADSRELYAQLEQKHAKFIHDSENTIEDLKLKLNIALNDAEQNERKYQISLDSQAQEIKRLQDINETKSIENQNLQTNKLQLEDEINKLRVDIDTLQDNLNFSERSKAQELQDLRIKLDESHQFSVQTMKQSFNNQVNIMEQEIQELNLKLQLRDKDLQQYIDRYSKMEAVIQDFVNNPEKLKNKADVITTKNLYDVLRTSNRSPVKRSYSPIKRSQIY